MKQILILAILIFLETSPLKAAWIDRKAEGWAWYEDPLVVEEKQTEETEITPSANPTAKLSEIKKIIEEKLALAVLEPTDQNIKAYMEEQHKWLAQSTRFSHTWAKVLLNNPHLDPTASYFPVSQYGVQVQNEINLEKLHYLINRLSQDYGFFFFYEGRSKVSQALSVVIREFSRIHQWEVIAISVDGVLLEGFENTKKDNGIVDQFSITTFPAIFLIDPQNKQAFPIAYGLVSLNQIEKNIGLHFKKDFEGGYDY